MHTADYINGFSRTQHMKTVITASKWFKITDDKLNDALEDLRYDHLSFTNDIFKFVAGNAVARLAANGGSAFLTRKGEGAFASASSLGTKKAFTQVETCEEDTPNKEKEAKIKMFEIDVNVIKMMKFLQSSCSEIEASFAKVREEITLANQKSSNRTEGELEVPYQNQYLTIMVKRQEFMDIITVREHFNGQHLYN